MISLEEYQKLPLFVSVDDNVYRDMYMAVILAVPNTTDRTIYNFVYLDVSEAVGSAVYRVAHTAERGAFARDFQE